MCLYVIIAELDDDIDDHYNAEPVSETMWVEDTEIAGETTPAKGEAVKVDGEGKNIIWGILKQV